MKRLKKSEEEAENDPLKGLIQNSFMTLTICKPVLRQNCSMVCQIKRVADKLSRLRMFNQGWSPGLVVMGGDSCSKGRGFESRRRILDGHDIFSHLFVVKIVLFV